MKTRLRKKTHVGAFVAWGAPMALRRRHPDGFYEFLDDFIEHAIEAQGLAFGGGGQGDRFTGVIEVGRAGDPIEARLQQIRCWLDTREDVKQYRVGELVDLCHGPFHDLETIDERLPDQ